LLNSVYPTLVGEIARRGIKKTVIAERLGISERTFYNKLAGNAQFTWPEVCKINSYFFPDMAPNDLFARCDGGR